MKSGAWHWLTPGHPPCENTVTDRIVRTGEIETQFLAKVELVALGSFYSPCRKSLCFWRPQSRLASVARLSWFFLPFAVAIFSFTRPRSLKYITSGTSVMPCRLVAFQSRDSSLR